MTELVDEVESYWAEDQILQIHHITGSKSICGIVIPDNCNWKKLISFIKNLIGCTIWPQTILFFPLCSRITRVFLHHLLSESEFSFPFNFPPHIGLNRQVTWKSDQIWANNLHWSQQFWFTLTSTTMDKNIQLISLNTETIWLPAFFKISCVPHKSVSQSWWVNYDNFLFWVNCPFSTCFLTHSVLITVQQNLFLLHFKCHTINFVSVQTLLFQWKLARISRTG